MWFKNLQIYRLPAGWAYSIEKMEEELSKRVFQPCGSQDISRRGWTSPTNDDRAVLSVGDHLLVKLMTEYKLLPAAVINQEAHKKAVMIEAQQGYKPGRKQIKEIKEATLIELLPKAFVRQKAIHAWIDLAGGWLVIDAPSPSKAEEVLDALRDSLDELPVKMLKTKLSPVSVMTAWLAANEATGDFTIDQDCRLRAVTDDNATVSYTHHALDGKDVQDHLAAGKIPEKLGMTFDDRISFVLTEKMEVRRLAFLDIVKADAKKEAESEDMQTEADFALMSGELSRLIPALIEALGGEVVDSPF